ncbi:MAG: phosphosulfolactate synthase [Heliobacteriaceae bacterium]|nr:phosphosulfolactate synthase [Heliobacteriaceae bacterium]MDD4588651.1 phosphosulfolactate synthase [Heliobacteriaceae bacterium]
METKRQGPLVKAWPYGDRNEKPRSTGVTMVFDKGLGLHAWADLLATAGEYIDFIKLGFGSAALYAPQTLEQKVALAREHAVAVYFGGTLTEIAFVQGNYSEYLRRLQGYGIGWVEVSDGTISLSPAQRRELIDQAQTAGFRVITEVGKKDPRYQIPLPDLIRQMRADWAAGAAYVIIEGRESGKGVNLFDRTGEFKADGLAMLVRELPAGLPVIWEAPLKNQQVTLIRLCGQNVNLGNIPAGEVIALESLRRGLRADTLRYTLPGD